MLLIYIYKTGDHLPLRYDFATHRGEKQMETQILKRTGPEVTLPKQYGSPKPEKDGSSDKSLTIRDIVGQVLLSTEVNASCCRGKPEQTRTTVTGATGCNGKEARIEENRRRRARLCC